MSKTYDAVFVGGGFFGLCLARYLKDKLGIKNVLVLEKEQDVMQRASYNNQARIHGGYHYPRSLLTGLRSQANFVRFVKEFEPAVVNDFDKYYAIATNFSKVSARQFKLFCDRIEAEIKPAPQSIKTLFNAKLIEDVFKVKEYAFNTAVMKEMLLKDLSRLGVELETGISVKTVEQDGDVLVVVTEDGKRINARHVYNCSYALLNQLNIASGLPLLPLKLELTEMCLIQPPKELDDISVTVMCGPFFSFMPFPARKLTTLSHVRYTPHSEWKDQADGYRDGYRYLNEITKVSHYPQMISDAQRYMPMLGKSEYVDSLWEIKTVLLQSEHDDSRPILFKKNHGNLHGYHCVMGGKLDNIYDAYKELDLIYG